MKYYALTFILISIVSTLAQEDLLELGTQMINQNLQAEPIFLFELFIKAYDKPYSIQSEEGQKRFKIFEEKLKYIRESSTSNTKKLYSLGLNSFSDLTNEEIKERYLDFTIPDTIRLLRQDKRNFQDETRLFLKKESKIEFTPKDWREYNLFNDARDQGECGACWAFAVTGAMEANFALKKGKPIEYLSVQQLVDCDTKEKGCKGGWPSIAYNYIQKTGVVSEVNYPYKASTNTCDDDVVSSSKKYKINKFVSCEEEECNKNNLFNTLLQKGPFAVVIDAYNTEFFNYKSGIYNQSCAEPNHAIVLVGYGVDEESGDDYWIIRNSWNKSWGMNGYGYVKNDLNNYYSCNINRYAFQPEVIS